MVIIREQQTMSVFAIICRHHKQQQQRASLITCLFQMMMADNFYVLHEKMRMLLIAIWQFFQVVYNFSI